MASAACHACHCSYCSIFYPSKEDLVAKCLELGLIMRTPANTVVHTPLTLEPFPIRLHVLEELQSRQVLWNAAIDRAARHPTFLRDTLMATAASDVDFTGKLLHLYEKVYLCDTPVVQPLMLGIFRSDYMPTTTTTKRDERNDAVPGIDAEEEADNNMHVLTPTAAAWKNVEVNTISVSFAGLSPLVTAFHAFIRSYIHAAHDAAIYPEAVSSPARASPLPPPAVSEAYQNLLAHGTLVESTSSKDIPAAMATAHEAWMATIGDQFLPLIQRYHMEEAHRHASDGAAMKKVPPLLPAVLVVTQEGERNTGDQYKLLLELLQSASIISVRRTLGELHRTMRLLHISDLLQVATPDEVAQLRSALPAATRHLYSSLESIPPFAVMDKRYVVTLSYFRSCYIPEDYPTPDCWAAREAVERSNAIKCPSLPHHLCTFKKVQQRLSEVEEVLIPVAFHGEREPALALAQHFVGQYALNKDEKEVMVRHASLSDQQQEEAHHAARARAIEERIQDAIAHPERYVLKPQLEGGGNIFAGVEMQRLLSVTLAEDAATYHKVRREFILMDRIVYPLRRVGFFRQEEVHRETLRMSSELGVYGVILSNGHTSNTAAEQPSAVGAKRGRGTEPGNASAAWPFTFNKCAGCITRTKPEGVDDGGVMAGLSCLDSLVAVP
eukprot:gene8974-6297_t